MHDLFLLLLAHALLESDLVFMHALDAHDAPLLVLFNLEQSEPFLLIDDLILHAILLFHPSVHVSLFLVVLIPNDLGLLRLLLLREEDGLLHLALLILALPVQHVVLLRHMALPFVHCLVVVDFLVNTKLTTGNNPTDLPFECALRSSSSVRESRWCAS